MRFAEAKKAQVLSKEEVAKLNTAGIKDNVKREENSEVDAWPFPSFAATAAVFPGLIPSSDAAPTAAFGSKKTGKVCQKSKRICSKKSKDPRIQQRTINMEK